MAKAKRPSGGSPASSRRVDLPPAFAAIVKRFAGNRRVAFGGQGFGSKGLRLDGKIFAMISLTAQFVVKLPRERVAELISLGRAEYFAVGRSRVMKEWIAVLGGPVSWRRLADEAYKYATARRTQLTESARRRTRG
jgi:TfoX/Sxy family transcriptional regulator of competence genes